MEAFFFYYYSLRSAAIRGRLSSSLRSGSFVTGGHFSISSGPLWSERGGNCFHDPVFMVICIRRIRWCAPLGMLDYSFIGCFMSVINVEFVTRWPWEKLIFTHEWIVVILFNVGKWTMIKSLASSWDEQCNINEKLLFRKEKVFHPQGFDYTFLLFVFSSTFSRFGNYAYGIPQMNIEIFL